MLTLCVFGVIVGMLMAYSGGKFWYGFAVGAGAPAFLAITGSLYLVGAGELWKLFTRTDPPVWFAVSLILSYVFVALPLFVATLRLLGVHIRF